MGGSLDIPANPVRDRQFGYDESTADRTVGNSAERLSGETVLAVPRLKYASTPTSDRLRVTASSGYPQSGEPDPLWLDDHRSMGTWSVKCFGSEIFCVFRKARHPARSPGPCCALQTEPG